jgi:hypothetical protein
MDNLPDSAAKAAAEKEFALFVQRIATPVEAPPEATPEAPPQDEELAG